MTISTRRLIFLRGNTAASSAFTGLQGELIVDTDLRTIRVQDGVTAGGVLLATSDGNYNASSTFGGASITNLGAFNANAGYVKVTFIG